MKGIFYVGVKVPKVTPNQTTGLDFPGSASVSTTMRFRFSNPQNNGLPIYGPNGNGVTYIWKAYPRKQPGHYTTFFWGNDGKGGRLHLLWFPPLSARRRHTT